VLESDILGVHLRRASTGTAQTLKEAHPFNFEHFLFAHNGYFAGMTLHPAEVGRPQSDSYEAGRLLHDLVSAANTQRITSALINQWLGSFNESTSFACLITMTGEDHDRVYALRNAARDLWASTVGNGYIVATSRVALGTLADTAQALYGITIGEPRVLLENILYTFVLDEQGTKLYQEPLNYTFKTFKSNIYHGTGYGTGHDYYDDDAYYGRVRPYPKGSVASGKAGASAPSTAPFQPGTTAAENLERWQKNRRQGEAFASTAASQGSSSSQGGTQSGSSQAAPSSAGSSSSGTGGSTGGAIVLARNSETGESITEVMERESQAQAQERRYGSFATSITDEEIVRSTIRGFVTKLSPLRKTFVLPLLLDTLYSWPVENSAWEEELAELTLDDVSKVRERLFGKSSNFISLPFTKDQKRLIDRWNRLIPSEIEYMLQEAFFAAGTNKVRWFWENEDAFEEVLEHVDWDFSVLSQDKNVSFGSVPTLPNTAPSEVSIPTTKLMLPVS
jgi:hypothetical protein